MYYRCSPNIAHFEVPYPSAFNNLPLCSDYCDSWYEACKEEMTCAVNWIFDWVYVDGLNYCINETCYSFRYAGNILYLLMVLQKKKFIKFLKFFGIKSHSQFCIWKWAWHM